VRIGRLQIAGSRHRVHKRIGRIIRTSTSHSPSTNPSVTVSLNDPGGVSTLQGGVGVWNLAAGGFDVLYKYNQNRAHVDTYYWLAVGTWM
jgi:hypothetical protein